MKGERKEDAPVLEEGALSSLLDLGNTLDGLESGLDELSIVSHGNVSSLLELEGGILV